MGLFDFFRKGEERKSPVRQSDDSYKDDAREPWSQPGKEAPSGVEEADKRMEFNQKDRPPAPSNEYYEVKKGDSLSKIAKERYGDASKWKLIYKANQVTLKSPDTLYPGQVIELPDMRK